MGTGRSFDAVFNNLQSQSERRLDGMTVDSRVDKKGPGPRILARPKLAFYLMKHRIPATATAIALLRFYCNWRSYWNWRSLVSKLIRYYEPDV